MFLPNPTPAGPQPTPSAAPHPAFPSARAESSWGELLLLWSLCREVSTSTSLLGGTFRLSFSVQRFWGAIKSIFLGSYPTVLPCHREGVLVQGEQWRCILVEPFFRRRAHGFRRVSRPGRPSTCWGELDSYTPNSGSCFGFFTATCSASRLQPASLAPSISPCAPPPPHGCGPGESTQGCP